jgi:hypothetical protein
MGKGSGVRSEAQLLRPQEVKLPVPLHWLVGSLGRINRVFPTSRPKIKLYYDLDEYLVALPTRLK